MKGGKKAPRALGYFEKVERTGLEKEMFILQMERKEKIAQQDGPTRLAVKDLNKVEEEVLLLNLHKVLSQCEATMNQIY